MAALPSTARIDRAHELRERILACAHARVAEGGFASLTMQALAEDAGYDVVVRSRSQASADAMVASIDKGFAKAIERGKSTEEERAAVLGRIQATDHLGAVADCDLVIESVVEDLARTLALFAELEQIVKPSGILATNTS